jgi:hypothetical protein
MVTTRRPFANSAGAEKRQTQRHSARKSECLTAEAGRRREDPNTKGAKKRFPVLCFKGHKAPKSECLTAGRGSAETQRPITDDEMLS